MKKPCPGPCLLLFTGHCYHTLFISQMGQGLAGCSGTACNCQYPIACMCSGTGQGIASSGTTFGQMCHSCNKTTHTQVKDMVHGYVVFAKAALANAALAMQ